MLLFILTEAQHDGDTSDDGDASPLDQGQDGAPYDFRGLPGYPARYGYRASADKSDFDALHNFVASPLLLRSGSIFNQGKLHLSKTLPKSILA